MRIAFIVMSGSEKDDLDKELRERGIQIMYAQPDALLTNLVYSPTLLRNAEAPVEEIWFKGTQLDETCTNIAKIAKTFDVPVFAKDSNLTSQLAAVGKLNA
jgi:hypothetical protein